MITNIEYALMAGRSYQTNRDSINWFPIAKDWTEFAHVPNNPSFPNFTGVTGFEAVSFTKGSEIVISFAGTDFSLPLTDFTAANIPLAAGFMSDQLKQAAVYYLQVKVANPLANITLTGHSLGGGLASLIAVMFNETAVTFDQAPFRAATSKALATELFNYLTGIGYSTQSLQELTNFIDATPIITTTIYNQDNVTDINVQGEVLGYTSYGRIGTQMDLLNSHNGVSSVNLHSQALLAAFLQSNESAATSSNPQQTLSQVTFKLPDLIKMFFDDKLFYNSPTNKDNPERNFLENLVRHQAGAGTTIPADAMVTRFTADLWKLAQDGGLTMNDGHIDATLHNVSKTLIAFAMQMYYEDAPVNSARNNATDPTKQLFDTVTGGVHFDMADVSYKFNEAFTQSTPVNLNDAKGYKEFFSLYLNDPGFTFTAEERSLITSLLPTMRDWYVQAGTTGMNTSDTHNRHAFMLGGATNDNLTGGNKADLLVGNAGNDTLNGGDGDDVLIGGADQDTLNGDTGNDTLIGGTDVDILDGGTGNDQLKGGEGVDVYQFTGTYGTDIITDTDGQGIITIDNTPLAGGKQIGDNRVHRDANKHLYAQVDINTLVIDGNIIIKNYTADSGALGLTMTGPEADVNPVTTRTIVGDLKPIDFDLIEPGVQTRTDGLGNVIVTGEAEPGREDTLYDSAGNDLVQGLDGDVSCLVSMVVMTVLKAAQGKMHC